MAIRHCQAVAVCLYELTSHTAPSAEDEEAEKVMRSRAAETSSLELLASVVDRVLEASRYSPDSMREANRHDMRLLLRRLAPTEKDVRRMLGLFRRILWQLKKRV